MKRTLFIESPIIKGLAGGEKNTVIQDIKEEVQNEIIDFYDVETYAEELSIKIDRELEVVGDDMENLYIQIVDGQNECFDEIGSWEE